jgi:RNA polymerase sigma-70 factor (ECF subfamily)
VALSELCETYRPAIYSFLRSRQSPHEADDLTQLFFAHLLNRDFLKNVDKSRGRFRSFLLKRLKNYLINEHAKASRKQPVPSCRFENQPRAWRFHALARRHPTDRRATR